MFFKESIQDKANKRQLICVKSFTLRIRFHLIMLDLQLSGNFAFYIGFNVLSGSCGFGDNFGDGVDGCSEEEGSLTVLHTLTQF